MDVSGNASARDLLSLNSKLLPALTFNSTQGRLGYSSVFFFSAVMVYIA